jgi:hypothetical protein
VRVLLLISAAAVGALSAAAPASAASGPKLPCWKDGEKRVYRSAPVRCGVYPGGSPGFGFLFTELEWLDWGTDSPRFSGRYVSNEPDDEFEDVTGSLYRERKCPRTGRWIYTRMSVTDSDGRFVIEWPRCT